MGIGKNIAVTGATGFLGSHLCERLIRDGFSVSILSRDSDKARKFEGRVTKSVIGDIADKNAVAELVDNVDTVIHLVSNFRTASGPPESYHCINVEGTETVLEASKKAGVKRLIHCSTIGVHGNVESTPANENSPFNPGDLYQETKVESENIVRASIGTSAMEIVIIRPCSIYGPGDMRMLKMFKMLANHTFFLVGPCNENFHAVYIDDLIDGFMHAMEVPGIDGDTFIIGGDEYLPLKDYITVVAKAVDAPSPFLRFPYWFFYGGAILCEAICLPLNIEPPLHRRRVRFYKNNRAFDISKARRLLGYMPKVSLEAGMKRTAKWYREHGFLN